MTDPSSPRAPVMGQESLSQVVMPVTVFHWPLLPSASHHSGPRGRPPKESHPPRSCILQSPGGGGGGVGVETKPTSVPVSDMSLASYLGSHFISLYLSFLLLLKWER